jgi:hypothetical protein
VTQLLNRAINKRLGIEAGKRNSVKSAKLEEVFGDLDRIADEVRDSLLEKRRT